MGGGAFLQRGTPVVNSRGLEVGVVEDVRVHELRLEFLLQDRCQRNLQHD